MQLPNNAYVAVVDGEKLQLFRNDGDAGAMNLAAMQPPAVDSDNKGSGGRHASSSANPSDSQQDEDGFAAGVAAMLNQQVMAGHIENLVIIAAPRTLGELRKHYHKTLSAKLLGEIAKDLTGHSMKDVEATVTAN
ncbi:host attachment protein [Falsiroseomonas sp.]|uniref:host attachment family protein n=1 Tax=Falsiroseomonas sp. TaxID=2870721 RepID=UPI002721B151|nr:host attachment protein [Falsiroseomonas sp.]MDO9503396.1 host attachment protein [Falsiroseomonas sp.]MDP3416257.1 host attachment protein [Falsiroseomonas sp.]